MSTPIIEITISEKNATLEDVTAVAIDNQKVVLSESRSFREKIESSRRVLLKAIDDEIPIYGVTTGFGKDCGKRMGEDFILKNGTHLARFHGCGTGNYLGVAETRAALFCRIVSLSRGYSGVSTGLLEAMAALLNYHITPAVPEEGSVGASGDLTPLSYIARVLSGEGKVIYQNKEMEASEAFRAAGIEPYVFKEKEQLAIMNGTATMTGIACCVYRRSLGILDGAVIASALAIHALKGNWHHYHSTIMKIKPFPGMVSVAEGILNLLETDRAPEELEDEELDSLQDPYSLRCAPQVIGVLYDALSWVKEWVETEVNSVNDNPVTDPESGEVLMGGNFYGGHIAFAMDSLKAAVASVGDMADRQVQLMVNAGLSRGLPPNVSRAEGDNRYFNSGFKAMSIAASALAAEALKNTMPAASFSRSTESHNQDKVSMGTIAARDAARISILVERILAINFLAAANGCEYRETLECRPRLNSVVNEIRKLAEPLFDDRPMDEDIENIAQAIGSAKIFRRDAYE